MPKKVTTQDWINKIENKFPKRYTFEHTKYYGQFIEMTITCKIHGNIQVVPKYVVSRNRDCNYCKGFVPDIEINQEKLQEWYVYEQETGHFKVRATGKILGTLTDGYLVVNMKGKVFSVHRLIYIYMHDYCPEVIDHVNHNRSDNRWINLRGGSYEMNNANIHGNCVVKQSNGYLARVFDKGEYQRLGTYDTYEDAYIVSQKYRQDRIDLEHLHSI